MSGKLTPPVDKNDHLFGVPGAAIELVEYGDFQCPHCGMAHPIVKKILEAFGKKLKFVFRHFPLANIHEYATQAAIAAEAAGKQHKFWEMHDMIFENQELLSEHALLDFAKAIELNMATFKMDLQDETLAEKVELNFESGVRSGVNGTPSFFINGNKYNGGYDYASIFKALTQLEKTG